MPSSAKLSVWLLLLVALASAGSSEASWEDVTFTPVKEMPCLTNTSSLFTTGEQYSDKATNGVLLDSYSMLTRWQGSISPVNYDLGAITGFSTPTPRTNYQYGWQPESSGAGSPGTQLSCTSGGMFLNTWFYRHVDFVELGGSFNHMFGYSWSLPNAPKAFVDANGNLSDLVLQVNAAFTEQGSHVGDPLAHRDVDRYPFASHSLFAYVRDTTSQDPELHEIPILALMAESEFRPASTGTPASPAITEGAKVNGGVLFDYAAGVWFGGGPIVSSTPQTTVIYTGATAVNISDGLNPSDPLKFYRVHISPKNLLNILDRIDRFTCPPVDPMHPTTPTCPKKGHSRNPRDYVVTYAGIISEAVNLDRKKDPVTGPFPPCPAPPPPDGNCFANGNYDQISAAMNFNALGIYRASPATSLLAGTVNLINSYYIAALGRPDADHIDLAGRDYNVSLFKNLTNQTDAIQKARDVAAAFFASAEYVSRGRNDAQYVDDLYRALLGRLPDPAQAYWIQLLAGGTSRTTVLGGFIYSPEYQSYTTTMLY